MKLIKKEISVPKVAKGKRLDKFLAEKVKDFSRTKMAMFINQGAVKVNGRTKKVSNILKGGEKISLSIEDRHPQLEPYKCSIPIIYEDDDIIVIDKPRNLNVHPLSFGSQNSVVNALLYMGKELSHVDQMRPGVVHRLDKETSGIMVFAKNETSHSRLAGQFSNREIIKIYKAVCWGVFKENTLTVDLPLARDTRNPCNMKVSFVEAKRAITEVTVLNRFRDVTFLALNILTGRTHQIRVHLKFLGYPIVGDKKYGRKDKYSEMFLHSHILGLYHPRTGCFLEFTSPLPKWFNRFVRYEAQISNNT